MTDLLSWPARVDGPASPSTCGSGLVRRPVRARHEAAKERVLGWLAAIDNVRLPAFGLTADEIVALRRAALKK